MFVDPNGEDAILVTNYGKYGLPISGHSLLLIQDSNGDWWITEFTGDSKNNASTYVRKMRESDWKRFENKTGFWHSLALAFGIEGCQQVYLSGDYTSSLDLALKYDNENNYPKYCFLTNNCLDYVQTLLREGKSASSVVQFYHTHSIAIIPSCFGHKTERAIAIQQIIDFFTAKVRR